MTETSQSRLGVFLLVCFCIDSLITIPGGMIGQASAHCEQGHHGLLDWEAGGTSSDSAPSISEDTDIHIPDGEDGTRWFKLFVEDEGTVIVPGGYCIPYDTEVTIYKQDGNSLNEVGAWGYGDYRSGDHLTELSVLSERGEYYLRVEIEGTGYDPYRKHIAFETIDAEPDDFAISRFEVTNSEVKVGDTASFDVRVRKDESIDYHSVSNRRYGPFTDTADVSLIIDGETVATEEITLDANESMKVEFIHDFTGDVVGRATVTIRVQPTWASSGVEKSRDIYVDASDSDDDGLYDYREEALGTDPESSDTDDDGLSDRREVNGPTDPLEADTDSDGLNDGRELELETDPVEEDTDGDGLIDGREVSIGTDPTSQDTDGDGLVDSQEVDIGTDPTKSDSDGDGLTDQREVDLGTDPTAADTDGDGLSDRQEVNGPTDPLESDTDGDGANDRTEVTGPTDPTDPDTDGDGVPDGVELQSSSDPLEVDTDDDLFNDRLDFFPDNPFIPIGLIQLLFAGVFFVAVFR